MKKVLFAFIALLTIVGYMSITQAQAPETFLGFQSPGTQVKGITGAVIASATTIAPTNYIHHVSGTTAVVNITVPYTGFAGTIVLIPDGAFTTTNAGNIAIASTAVVSKALYMTYDLVQGKWYPSY